MGTRVPETCRAEQRRIKEFLKDFKTSASRWTLFTVDNKYILSLPSFNSLYRLAVPDYQDKMFSFSNGSDFYFFVI
jgi:hypothetical protein